MGYSIDLSRTQKTILQFCYLLTTRICLLLVPFFTNIFKRGSVKTDACMHIYRDFAAPWTQGGGQGGAASFQDVRGLLALERT